MNQIPKSSDISGLTLLVLVLAAGFVTAQENPRPAPASLTINQLQLLGTHNSYHVAPDKVAMGTIRLFAGKEAESLDVSMPPLQEQLEQYGVRHFELDLYLDPEGKLFQKPAAYEAAIKSEVEVPAFDPDGVMKKPGIKILHSPDFDYRTTVYTLVDALDEIKTWSDKHPDHVPIFVLLELKSDSYSPMTSPLSWDWQALESLEEEILSVWPRDRVLAPDDIRNGKKTIREAVEGIGWPSLESTRGKIVFLLDDEGSVRDLYLSKSQVMEGRLIFTSVARTHDAAAWMKRNNPVASFDEIVSLVKAGFLVRTRADEGTVETRQNDTGRRDRAISSKAQLISTDFIKPDLRWSDYQVALPAND